MAPLFQFGASLQFAARPPVDLILHRVSFGHPLGLPAARHQVGLEIHNEGPVLRLHPVRATRSFLFAE